ncbi:MAG: hypothetical protein HY040_25525, partial [Planctomycetes bacterium]|nr:hypothetical protein [Planctomycetota bacterium]
MKRFFLATAALILVVGAVALSGNQQPSSGDLQIDVDKRNPWTSLNLNNSPETFH